MYASSDFVRAGERPCAFCPHGRTMGWASVEELTLVRDHCRVETEVSKIC